MDSGERLVPDGDDSLEKAAILRDPRQRRILSLLLERTHPMTARDLSIQLAAAETDTAAADVPEKDYRSIRIDLHHRCLPMLAAVAWIERYPGGIVADEPLSVGGDDLSLSDFTDPDLPSWEALSAIIGRPRRQDIATIVADQGRDLAIEDLAAELREYGHTQRDAERNESGLSRLSTLHHIDLPRLAEVGLVEYDRTQRTIAPTDSLLTLVDRMDASHS